MPFIFTPSFLRYPATQQLDAKLWCWTLPFCFIRPSGERIFVPPAGLGDWSSIVQDPITTTDHGSIPRLFSNIFPPNGVLTPGFDVHDCLYAGELKPRDECDEVLYEAGRELGADMAEMGIIYGAVRAGGGAVWAAHDPVKVTMFQAYYKSFVELIPTRWPELLGPVPETTPKMMKAAAPSLAASFLATLGR
jgi:hypothetical protein